MLLRTFNTLFPASTYSPSKEVPSALTGLTAEFGKGSGVTLSLKTLETVNSKHFQRKQHFGQTNIHSITFLLIVNSIIEREIKEKS